MRDRIIIEHLPLVKAIAIRVHENLPVHVDLDDLTHAGVLGLFDAVTKYDSQKNVAFHAYAKHRIKGAILDSLRQLDWASRDLRKRQKQVDSVTHTLSAKLGRTPLEGEVAEELGLSPDRWHKIQLELRTVGTVSANATADPEFDRPMEFPAAPESQPDRMCGHRQLQTTLARVMETLPKRYQKVVFLYYTNEMTMKEIGEAMGVNESRVSQIHKIALKKMATVLESEGIHSADAF
ncbi:MAG TPA: FliA/WhiG family RNA polymerase sigma factor [Bryobacteraceae bacterium]|jgi:RNA polymerase sigma factor for flagellar operon FliA|nr:FliA/WhiG family RNA polymerase sigma factor [Bryobacteraceae bacterium]